MFENLEEIVNAINANQEKYGFKESSDGREALRKLTRHMEGLSLMDPTKKSRDKRNVNPHILKLCKGQDYKLSIGLLIDCGINSPTPLVINGADVVAARNGVQLYYMQDKITPDQIQQIQEAKINKARVNNHKELERLASYMVVVGEAQQYNEADGSVIPETDLPNRKHVFYYGAFPKLVRGSLDCDKLVSRRGQLQRDDELKEKFKDIIRMYCFVAAQRGEGLDIVTPNAFFYGLSQGEQQDKAKKLFRDSAVEVIEEINQDERFKGFKGLFLHERVLPDMPRLYTNTGDASSPNRVAMERHLGFRVAECIMGEALSKIGNGAVGNRADKAKEENDTRKCAGTIQAVFTSPLLLNPENYMGITRDFEIQHNAAFNPMLAAISMIPAALPLTMPKATPAASAHNPKSRGRNDNKPNDQRREAARERVRNKRETENNSSYGSFIFKCSVAAGCLIAVGVVAKICGYNILNAFLSSKGMDSISKTR